MRFVEGAGRREVGIGAKAVGDLQPHQVRGFRSARTVGDESLESTHRIPILADGCAELHLLPEILKSLELQMGNRNLAGHRLPAFGQFHSLYRIG